MRDVNTTADPDRAYLTWALIEERQRMTSVMNGWLLLQPRQVRRDIHEACNRILTEVKSDGAETLAQRAS